MTRLPTKSAESHPVSIAIGAAPPLSWRLSRDGDGLAYHLLQPDSPTLS